MPDAQFEYSYVEAKIVLKWVSLVTPATSIELLEVDARSIRRSARPSLAVPLP